MLLDDFNRVSRARPCPVCNRIKFCMIDRQRPDDPDRVICTKMESDRKWGEAGWLHVMRHECRPLRQLPRVRHAAVQTRRDDRMADLARRFTAAIDPGALAGCGASLGLTERSLLRLGIGWADGPSLRCLTTTCRGKGCWSFPMYGKNGAVVGIRLRTEGGFKYAVAGGKQGLFVPTDLDAGDRLLIAEGPTDTAALLDLGFDAIGRPSCTGGGKLIVALVRRLRPRQVVIVSDGDEAGLRGAASLEATLRLYAKSVRAIRPPANIKDARVWKTSSPDPTVIARQIEAAIEASPTRPVVVTVRRGGR